MLSRRSLLYVFALLVACSSRPQDPVAALLHDLEEAAEARDATRIGTLLSPGFSGGEGAGSRDDALATLRRYLAAYEEIALNVHHVEVDRNGAAARVRCVVEMSGRGRKIGGLENLLPPEAVYKFELDVAEEGGAWRVRRAGWTAPPAAP